MATETRNAEAKKKKTTKQNIIYQLNNSKDKYKFSVKTQISVLMKASPRNISMTRGRGIDR